MSRRPTLEIVCVEAANVEESHHVPQPRLVGEECRVRSKHPLALRLSPCEMMLVARVNRVVKILQPGLWVMVIRGPSEECLACPQLAGSVSQTCEGCSTVNVRGFNIRRV